MSVGQVGDDVKGPNVAARRWTIRLLQWVLILVVSTSFVVLHTRAYPKLSPIDELQHVDYLYSVSHLQLVHTGQHVGEQAMQAEACMGGDLVGFTFPRCGSHLTPGEFPGGGYSTADIHPPGYYVITALGAKSLQATGVTGNFVIAARITGGLWLGAGLVVIFELAMLLGVRRMTAWAILGLLVSSPEIVYSSSIVNPDATGLLAGSLVLLAVIQWERRKWPIAALALVAVGVSLLKSTWLLAILAACLYLLHGALPFVFRKMKEAGSGRRSTEYIKAIGVLGVIGVGAQGAWVLYRHATAVTSDAKVPVAEKFHVNSLSAHDIVTQLFSMFLPTDRALSPVLTTHTVVLLGMNVFDIIFTAGLLAAFFLTSRSMMSTLGIATFGAFIFGSIFLVVGTYVSTSDFVPLPARYGFALLPWMAIVTAKSLRNRFAAGGVAVVSAGIVVSTFVILAGAANL